jgi:hypothetical protein
MDAKVTHAFANNSTFAVDARYQPQRVIGMGAYGVVCAARDRLTNKEVCSRHKLWTACLFTF